jgi:hypothetical protein
MVKSFLKGVAHKMKGPHPVNGPNGLSADLLPARIPLKINLYGPA